MSIQGLRFAPLIVAALSIAMACSGAEEDRKGKGTGEMEPLPPPTNCTQIACSDMAEISLQHVGEWAPGLYRMEISLDDQPTLACEGVLPAGRSTISDFCPGTQGATRVHLNAVDNELRDIVIFGTPVEIRVQAFLDGAPIAESVLMPNYEVVMPNGPQCTPTCQQADDLRMEVGVPLNEMAADAAAGDDAG